MAALENVLIKPLITEKISLITENNNSYGFKVGFKANKNQIREAVEKLYDVKVVAVKTIIMPGKVKRRGKTTSKTSKWKKALIQIENGQKIELFKGV